METIEATEKLLQDLSDLHAEPIVEPVEKTPPEARNPFAESFLTEEVLIDQYASFEAQLLSTAACVVNHQDRQFASELERCEPGRPTVGELPSERPTRVAVAQGGSAADLELKDAVQDTIPLEALSGMAKPSGDTMEDVVRHEQATPYSPARPAENQKSVPLPSGNHSAILVQGRQFRQLFSQLESGNRSPIYG